MEYSVIQVLLVFVVTFIAAIDQFSFLESLYQPIVTGSGGRRSSWATCHHRPYRWRHLPADDHR